MVGHWIDVARRVRHFVPTRRDWISIGTFCHAAAALRDTGLRRWSGPFDWIFSTPALVADCIEDDFEAFLQWDQFQSVPREALTEGAKRQCRHVLFEQRYGLPVLFNHHDPASNSADRDALIRGVERFRSALTDVRGHVFFMLSDRPRADEDLLRLERLIAERGHRNRTVVFTIEVGPGRSSDIDTSSARIRGVVRLQTCSTGVRFVDPADDEFLARAITEAAARLRSR